VTRVLLLVLDGLGLHHVTPELMPTLYALGPVAGRGVMCSSTYPNHASFSTGVHPLVHGITANWVVRGGRWLQAHEVGPSAPTLFDRCHDAGVASAAVFGDQHLVQVTGAGLVEHWPPLGVLPAGCALDADGYAQDSEVLPRLLQALRGPARFVMAQLNGGDCAAHANGPGSPEAAAAYASYDECLSMVLQQAPDWVVHVVSDHAQIDGIPGPALDLWSHAPAGVQIVPEGDAALILQGAQDSGWLDSVEGVRGHEAYGPHRLVWGEPGRLIGPGDAHLAGVHGGPATLTQVNAARGDILPAEGLDGIAWATRIALLLGL
jgi:hypothetical protein